MKRRAQVLTNRASADRSAAGRHIKRTNGFAPAAMSGTPRTRAASAHTVCTGGLKPGASRAPAGHRIRIGMHGDALTSGSKHRTAAKAETTGCARASHRAFDSQRRGRSRSAVWCPARRRCALATRFRQWSVQRPSLTISNRRAGRSIRNGISKDRDRGICPFPVDPPATTCHMQPLAGGAELQ